MLNTVKLFASSETKFDSLIGENVSITGDITFTGELRVDGTVKGEINVYKSTQGTVVIGRTGSVEGKINVTNAVVSGKVKGSLTATDVVGLSSTGRIEGDVQYGRMVVRGQAQIHGRLVPSATEGREYDKAFDPNNFDADGVFSSPARATGT